MEEIELRRWGKECVKSKEGKELDEVKEVEEVMEGAKVEERSFAALRLLRIRILVGCSAG